MRISYCRMKTCLIPRGKVREKKCQRRHHCGNYHTHFCSSPFTLNNRNDDFAFILPFFQCQHLWGSWGWRGTFPGGLNRTKQSSLFRWGCTSGKAGVQARLSAQMVLPLRQTRRNWVCLLAPLSPPRRPTPISSATAQKVCLWSPTRQDVSRVYISNVNKWVQKHLCSWKECKALMRMTWPASGKNLQKNWTHWTHPASNH